MAGSGGKIRWQNQYDVDKLAMDLEEGAHLVVVSGRVNSPPPLPESRTLTWAYLPPLDLSKKMIGLFGNVGRKSPGFWMRILKKIFFTLCNGDRRQHATFAASSLLVASQSVFLAQIFVVSRKVSKTRLIRSKQSKFCVYHQRTRRSISIGWAARR